MADAAPRLQVSSAEVEYSNGVMQTKSPTSQGAGQVVQTASVQYPYDTLSSDYPNEALAKLSKISVSVRQSSNSPFVQASVQGVARLPGMTQRGDGSVVVFFTAMGRVVLNGTRLAPATGELAAMSDAYLYSKAAEPAPPAGGGACRVPPRASRRAPSIFHL
jgi:hypothetical protein